MDRPPLRPRPHRPRPPHPLDPLGPGHSPPPPSRGGGGNRKIARLALPLLYPTYLILAVACANTVYFYQLYRADRIDFNFPFFGKLPPVPMCLWLAPVFILWIYTIRARLARQLTPDPSPLTPAFPRLLATLSLAVIATLAVCFVALHHSQNPPAEPVDLAVVLGNRVLPDGRASVILADRTRAAVNLYHQHLVKKILCSGMIDIMKPKYNRVSEAAAMRQVCLDLGVPDADILVDETGINTHATVAATLSVMRLYHYSSLVACSDDFHLPRIRLSFAQAGLSVYTAEAPKTEWLQADLGCDLRELGGYLVYRLVPSYHSAKALPMLHLTSPRIVVTKSKNLLELFDGPAPVKTYPCLTGTNPGDKEMEGDRKTPEGHFRIIFKNPKSNYHLSLGLNYPRLEDAQRGLASGLISQAQYDAILAALNADLSQEALQKPYWSTPLGGEIFIHGQANRPATAQSKTSSAGCVVVSDLDIEELYEICPLNTPVEIRP